MPSETGISHICMSLCFRVCLRAQSAWEETGEGGTHIFTRSAAHCARRSVLFTQNSGSASQLTRLRLPFPVWGNAVGRKCLHHFQRYYGYNDIVHPTCPAPPLPLHTPLPPNHQSLHPLPSITVSLLRAGETASDRVCW